MDRCLQWNWLHHRKWVDGRTDGRTDRWMDKVKPVYPPQLCWRGYKYSPHVSHSSLHCFIMVTAYECHGISNYRQLDCLFDSWFALTSKETSQLLVGAYLLFVRGIHQWPGDSHHKEPVMQRSFPCHNIIKRCNIPTGIHNYEFPWKTFLYNFPFAIAITCLSTIACDSGSS